MYNILLNKSNDTQNDIELKLIEGTGILCLPSSLIKQKFFINRMFMECSLKFLLQGHLKQFFLGKDRCFFFVFYTSIHFNKALIKKWM